VQPAACPPAPAELLFLRDRELWVCAEAGGMPTEVLHDEAILRDVVKFWVASGGRVVLLLTQEGALYAFDREVDELTLIPTVGQLESTYGTWVAPSPDGTDVLYLAWGVQPGRGPAAGAEGSATLVQGSFDDPRAPHRAVAYCEGSPERPCRGFWLSPDGTAAVLGDRDGFWYISLAAPEEKRLALSDPDGEVVLLSWSPSGQWVLLAAADENRPALTMFAPDSSVSGTVPATSWRATPLCITPCRIGATWASDSSLWITWETGLNGCVAHVDPTEMNGDTWVPVEQPPALCNIGAGALRPWAPDTVISRMQPAFVLAFLQPEGDHRAGGLYALAEDHHIEPIALLPKEASSVRWSRDGNVFLVLDHDGNALRMGVLRPPMLFDVEELLRGAHHLTWSVPAGE